MEFYEIANQAIFDEPVQYKGIKIYPITIKYYQLVKAASDVFSINIAGDTDIDLIGLPYMEYLMKKAIKEPDFIHMWNIFNNVLQLSFQEQMHSFKYDGDFLRLVVAVPTEKYNDETMCVYREKLKIYHELTKDSYHELLNELQVKHIGDEIKQLENEMFTFHTFNDNDFNDIKKIICFLNDIDDTIIEDVRWEAELKKAQKIINEINNNKNPPTLEDLIDAVAYNLNKLPSEIQNMTVRRFDRYLDLEIKKENYKLCRQAELSGTEFKRPLTHWLTAYKPKGRYATPSNDGNGVQDVLNNKKE